MQGRQRKEGIDLGIQKKFMMLDEAMKTVKTLSQHYAYISVASYSSLYDLLPSAPTEETLESYQQHRRIPQK
jgi:hypothetical protein